MADEQWLIAQEVADRLGYTVRKVGKLWRAGKFSHSMGDTIEALRIPESDLASLGKPEKPSGVESSPVADKELTAAREAVAKERKDFEKEKQAWRGEVETARKSLAEERRTFAKDSIADVEKLRKMQGDAEAVRSQTEKERAEFEAYAEAEKAKLKELGEKLAGELIELDRERQALAERASQLTIGEENLKTERVTAVEKISKADEAHKQKRLDEDRKRREKHVFEVADIEEAYSNTHDASPQELNNRRKELILIPLERIMDSWGIPRQFDSLNRYVKREDRAISNEDELRDTSDKAIIPDEATLPGNIRDAYSMCFRVYNHLKAEPVHGVEFCRQSYRQYKVLRGLLQSQNGDGLWVDRDNSEILTHSDAILSVFDTIHGYLMAWAGEYQDDPKGDWASWTNWLCVKAIELENSLGVGVSK